MLLLHHQDLLGEGHWPGIEGREVEVVGQVVKEVREDGLLKESVKFS